jgi:hypothetical protein
VTAGMCCNHCGSDFVELTMDEALDHTRKRFMRRYVQGNNIGYVDRHMQYIFASYFGDSSLTMIHWINKNHLKYGREYDRFLIRPFNLADLLNLPWLFFNIIDSNFFHMRYDSYCPECDCKYIAGTHTAEKCQYNQMFLNILKDALNGDIVHTKKIYEVKALEDRKKRIPNAFTDLQPKWRFLHVLLDFSSVTVSVLTWTVILVYAFMPVIVFLLRKSDLYKRLFI